MVFPLSFYMHLRLVFLKAQAYGATERWCQDLTCPPTLADYRQCGVL
jgi:hypothetical protein